MDASRAVAVRTQPGVGPLGLHKSQHKHRSRYSLRGARFAPLQAIPQDRSFDDPHKTPPPRTSSGPANTAGTPTTASWSSISLSSADLEFGADPLSGEPLETKEQMARQGDERLRQQDIAREAYQDTETHKMLTASESTAGDREERYQGILQAIGELSQHVEQRAQHGQQEAGGASDSEPGYGKMSRDAERLAHAGDDQGQRFEELRQSVDKLGEGDQAAELIRRSYEGRNLEAEALGSMEPSDSMPHPGDRYLPPHALPARQPAGNAAAARMNQTHARPSLEERRVLPVAPARGGGAAAPASASSSDASWLPPEGDSQAAARAQHEPVGQGEGGTGQPQHAQQAQQALPNDDQIDLGGAAGASGGPADDQIGLDQDLDALRGSDAQYYAPEHAANPAVNDPGSGGSRGSAGNVEAPDAGYDVEGEALRGSDAMFYFSGFNFKGGNAKQEESLVKGALQEGVRQAGNLATGKGPVGMVADFTARQVMKKTADAGMQEVAHQVTPHSGRKAPPGRVGLGRVVEVASGRAAALGLAAALAGELLTGQSVLSQLWGRFEGPRQVEAALPACQSLAAAVVTAALIAGTVEWLKGDGVAPRWRVAGLPPFVQIWLGRVFMAAFLALLAYETMHSNRPAFSTLFFTWY